MQNGDIWNKWINVSFIVEFPFLGEFRFYKVDESDCAPKRLVAGWSHNYLDLDLRIRILIMYLVIFGAIADDRNVLRKYFGN